MKKVNVQHKPHAVKYLLLQQKFAHYSLLYYIQHLHYNNSNACIHMK